ncbi:LysM peptidoglycan-binding domain-containing protein [soil metagenome]
MGRLGPGLPALAMEKARLSVVEGAGLRSWELKFQYNPSDLTVERSGEWTDPPVNSGRQQPKPTFRKINPRTVSMDIFFDGVGLPPTLGDVTGDVNTLLEWTKPCPEKIGPVYQPPILRLDWGNGNLLPGFIGYLSRVSSNYTMFGADGTPVRARCSITLNEVPTAAAGTNPTSGGRPGFQVHVLIEGETLHSVAWAEYRDARCWRALAEFNGIDDPLRVPVGTELLLPPASDAARMS